MVAKKKAVPAASGKTGWYVYRDAITGRFVGMVFALKNKATTVRDWIAAKLLPTMDD